MPPFLTQPTNKEAALLPVHVVPNAARNEVVAVEGETLKVRVTAPPLKGKANEALIKLLAKTLGLPKNQLEIVSGRRARRKMVRVQGIDENEVLNLLQRRQSKR